MLKRKLPRAKPKGFFQKDAIVRLIQGYIILETDRILHSRDIEVQYFDGWPFYRVTIFQEGVSTNENGNPGGTKDHLLEKFLLMQKTIEKIFDLSGAQHAWRWIEANPTANAGPSVMREITPNSELCCPGTTYYINIENAENVE